MFAGLLLGAALAIPAANGNPAPTAEPEFKVTSVKQGTGEPLASIEDLVLMEVGKTLRYRELVVGEEDEAFLYDEKLDSIKEEDGARLLLYTWTEVGTEPDAEVIVAGERLVRLDDGVWTLRERSLEWTVVYRPGMLEIPTDLREGAEQKAVCESHEVEDGEEIKGKSELHYRVMGTATVTTPAGEFEDCVRIMFREVFTMDGEQTVSMGEEFLKPGFGLVRREVRFEDEVSVTELMAINPEG